MLLCCCVVVLLCCCVVVLLCCCVPLLICICSCCVVVLTSCLGPNFSHSRNSCIHPAQTESVGVLVCWCNVGVLVYGVWLLCDASMHGASTQPKVTVLPMPTGCCVVVLLCCCVVVLLCCCVVVLVCWCVGVLLCYWCVGDLLRDVVVLV